MKSHIKYLLAAVLLLMAVSALRAQGFVYRYEELEQRDDSLYYLKTTTEPFTGTAEGLTDTDKFFMRIRFVKGMANGMFEGFYDEARTIPRWTVNFTDGKREGPHLYFYEDGTLSFEVNMVNDEMEGVRRCYGSDGALWHIHNYVNGKEEGLMTSFYPSGKTMEVIHYHDGLRDGAYQAWFEDGQLEREGFFNADQKVGTWKQYDQNGKVEARYKYKKR